MAKNNEAVGGAVPHHGDNVKAICRGAGYQATMGAFGSKTRSSYNAAGGKHYRYEAVGELSSNDNLKGHSPE